MDTASPRRARKWVRLRRRFKVAFQHSASFTVDVSPGGFCAELLRVLPVGTGVGGTITVRGTDVAFAGRVVWARPGDAHLGLRGRMGVVYTQIAAGFIELAGGLAGSQTQA